jgi:hypothetical protein
MANQQGSMVKPGEDAVSEVCCTRAIEDAAWRRASGPLLGRADGYADGEHNRTAHGDHQ